jgi:DNA-binding IscR family transcriptional regulator
VSGNSHFTIALHILNWIALAEQNGQEVITSDRIAVSVNTNPVFIRRILGVLEKAHLVVVQHGTRARWKLARVPASMTLLEVYQAVTSTPLFELHHSSPNQTCPIGRGIQSALRHFYSEAAMKQQLARTTLADVLRETLTHSRQTLTTSADEQRNQGKHPPDPTTVV